jgi:hypothetical protein
MIRDKTPNETQNEREEQKEKEKELSSNHRINNGAFCLSIGQVQNPAEVKSTDRCVHSFKEEETMVISISPSHRVL